MQTTQAPQMAKQTAATRSTKHNKLFQPITDKKALGVGFVGSMQNADEEEGGSI